MPSAAAQLEVTPDEASLLSTRLVISAAVVLLSTAFVIVAALAAAPGQHLSPRTYYVSPSGSDRSHGTLRHPWRTVARVDRAHLVPGDRILFQGGRTFTDATLIPSSSGSPGKPIVFGSYGRGRATIANSRGAVWFSGRSDITFSKLRLTTNDADAVILAGSTQRSDRVTLEGCLLLDSKDAAVNQPSSSDTGWVIRDNSIRHVGDSALILQGAEDVVRNNVIEDVGWNTALDYGKHGIYAKGPEITIVDNRIDGFTGSGISLRYPDARVYRNTISKGDTGIAFFREDTQVGTSYIVGNLITGTGIGFYYDDGGGENFVIENNTIDMTGGTAIDIQGSPATSITVSGNLFLGDADYVLAVQPFAEGATFAESNDSFEMTPTFSWHRQPLDLPGYRLASGQGAGDSIGFTPR